MRVALAPAALEREEAQFELDRFGPANNGRLELSGHWYGVRGRRFVRPTLTIVTELSRTRMLADLEHKPWAADDGGSWQASFPWEPDGTDIVDVELAVAPDIAITLPPPGADSEDWPRALAQPAAPRAQAAASASTEPSRADPEVELRELTRALKAEHRKARRLVAELERTRSEAVDATAEQQQAQATIGELQEALGEAMRVAEQAMAERDEATEARELARTEHDQEARIRDQALAERDEAIAERNAAVTERDAAIADRDQVIAERDEARAARDEALAARKRALAERKRALNERDKARHTRERAISEGRRLLAERKGANEELRAELTRALSERDMVLRQLDAMKARSDAQLGGLRAQLEEAPRRASVPVETPAAEATAPLGPAAPPHRPAPPAPKMPPVIMRTAHSARRTQVDWLRRAAALTVLLAVVFALLIVARLI